MSEQLTSINQKNKAKLEKVVDDLNAIWQHQIDEFNPKLIPKDFIDLPDFDNLAVKVQSKVLYKYISQDDKIGMTFYEEMIKLAKNLKYELPDLTDDIFDFEEEKFISYFFKNMQMDKTLIYTSYRAGADTIFGLINCDEDDLIMPDTVSKFRQKINLYTDGNAALKDLTPDEWKEWALFLEENNSFKAIHFDNVVETIITTDLSMHEHFVAVHSQTLILSLYLLLHLRKVFGLTQTPIHAIDFQSCVIFVKNVLRDKLAKFKQCLTGMKGVYFDEATSYISSKLKSELDPALEDIITKYVHEADKLFSESSTSDDSNSTTLTSDKVH